MTLDLLLSQERLPIVTLIVGILVGQLSILGVFALASLKEVSPGQLFPDGQPEPERVPMDARKLCALVKGGTR